MISFMLKEQTRGLLREKDEVSAASAVSSVCAVIRVQSQHSLKVSTATSSVGDFFSRCGAPFDLFAVWCSHCRFAVDLIGVRNTNNIK